MAERPAASSSGSPAAHVPQIIGRLGLYATFAAAALLLVAIGGDLDVLALRAPLVGWLALVVGAGPLVALLFSTLASYINYYYGIGDRTSSVLLSPRTITTPRSSSNWIAPLTCQ